MKIKGAFTGRPQQTVVENVLLFWLQKQAGSVELRKDILRLRLGDGNCAVEDGRNEGRVLSCSVVWPGFYRSLVRTTTVVGL